MRAEVASGGCLATSTVQVFIVDHIYVPAAFSPNGDGQNDVWKLLNTEAYPDCDVRVFNRWGELVYQVVGAASSGWDGTYQQNPVPTGTYTYLVQPAPDLPPLRGSVTVLR